MVISLGSGIRVSSIARSLELTGDISVLQTPKDRARRATEASTASRSIVNFQYPIGPVGLQAFRAKGAEALEVERGVGVYLSGVLLLLARVDQSGAACLREEWNDESGGAVRPE
jgi:hypothetical protein